MHKNAANIGMFFFKQNPWLVEEGLLVDIEEDGSSREEVIKELRDALSDGYSIDSEKVIIFDSLSSTGMRISKESRISFLCRE